jgi:hypothetical protein
MTEKPIVNNNFIESVTNVHKRHLLGCAQKAEKIWSACILVSDIMRSEDLPKKILGCASSIHSELYDATRLGPSEKTAESVLSHIDELLSLVRIGMITEELSPMNAGILARETELLSEQVKRILILVRTKQSSSSLFSPSFINGAEPVLDQRMFQSEFFDSVRFGENLFEKDHSFSTQKLQPETAPRSKDLVSKGQIKTTVKDIQNDTQKDRLIIQNDTIGHIKNPVKNKEVSEVKMNRKEEVLRIVGVRKSSTIADLTTYINDCSIKTLQRILGELVGEGKIQRRGNKRWTTYHII